MFKRTAFSILLLVAVLPLVTSGAPISAQSFTTITGFVTLTTQLTSTSRGVYTIGTSYTTSTEKAMLYTGPFTLGSPGSNYGCWLEHFPFTATKGQVISGQLTSSIAISFFVMREDAFKKWDNTNRCDVRVDTMVKKEGITSYSLSLNISNDGQYEFLFLNFSPNTEAQVEFDVGIEGGSVTTITRPIYSSTSAATVLTVTQTSSFARTEEVSLLQFDSNNIFLVAIMAVVVVVIVVGGFVAFRKFSGKGKTGSVTLQKGEIFCINCAAPLPQGAKFCNRCGATQP